MSDDFAGFNEWLVKLLETKTRSFREDQGWSTLVGDDPMNYLINLEETNDDEDYDDE